MPLPSGMTRFTFSHSMALTLSPVRTVAPFASIVYVVPSQNSAVDPRMIANPVTPRRGDRNTTNPTSSANAAAPTIPANF